MQELVVQVCPSASSGNEFFEIYQDNKEFKNWKSQFVTSNSGITGLRKMPYVFTEQGICMLASVLPSTSSGTYCVRCV